MEKRSMRMENTEFLLLENDCFPGSIFLGKI